MLRRDPNEPYLFGELLVRGRRRRTSSASTTSRAGYARADAPRRPRAGHAGRHRLRHRDRLRLRAGPGRDRAAPGRNLVGAAVVCAALLCAALARALGRLATVVPSGAGLLAFLSRGLGRRWALLLMLPYVALVLALVAVEARIVGAVIARLLPIPPAVGALALPGVHLGGRPQRRAPGAARAGGGDRAAGGRVLAAGGGGSMLAAARQIPTSSRSSCRRRRRRWPARRDRPGAVPVHGLRAGDHPDRAGARAGAIARRWCAACGCWPSSTCWPRSGFSTLAAPGLAPAARRLARAAARRSAPPPASPLGAAAIGILCLLASFTSFNGALLRCRGSVVRAGGAGAAAAAARPHGRAPHGSRPTRSPLLLAAVVALTFLLSTHALINAGARRLGGRRAALVWAAAVAVRERAALRRAGPPAPPPGRRASRSGVAVRRLRPGRARRGPPGIRCIPRAWRSPMPIDLSVARWTRDVAVTQWNRDDGALAAIGGALPAGDRRRARAGRGAPAGSVAVRRVRGGRAAGLGRAGAQRAVARRAGLRRAADAGRGPPPRDLRAAGWRCRRRPGARRRAATRS